MSGPGDDDLQTRGEPNGSSPLMTGGRRRDGQPYRVGNTREDGSYAVGRNRPPASGQFAVGDGRQRGRRAKGVRNADTEFARELNRRMVVKENGVERKVTKSHAVDLRLIDNAARKGDNRAIEMVDARRRRIVEANEQSRLRRTESDQAILEAYLCERADALAIDPHLFGDPVPDLPVGDQGADPVDDAADAENDHG